MNAHKPKWVELPKLLLIAGFIALLWLPTVDSFFKLDKAPSPNEGRELNRFPEFNGPETSIKSYLTGVEQYFNDHFGFRKRLIRWNNRWKKSWFKDSSMADVITGRDGWLYHSGAHMIDHFRGTKLFKVEELQRWQELLEGRRDWLRERGIKYLFVIPPDKHSVYPEYLPEWLNRVGSTTKLDQFVEHMKVNSNLDILDLRQPLQNEKQKGRLYMCTDTHWNALGSFAAYSAIMAQLKTGFPEFEPFSLDHFVQEFEDRAGGDLAMMLGLGTTLMERENIILKPKDSVPGFEIERITNFLNRKWRTEAEPALTRNPAGQYKAFFFHDSFTGAMIPFLGLHFSEAYFLWQYNWNKALIENERPDLVVDAILERYLYSTDPRMLKQLDETSESVSSYNL